MLDMIMIFGAKYLLWLEMGLALVWFLKQPRGKQKQIIFFAAGCFPAIFFASRLISMFYFNPRPFVVDNFVPLIPHEPDNGFPSDHTLLGAAIAVTTYPFGKKISLLFGLLAILTGVSRMLTGIHHLIDVVGSLAIALLLGFLGYKLFKTIKFKDV